MLASAFSGANAAFLADLYAKWIADPNAVDPSFRELFGALNDEARAVLTDAAGASWAPRRFEFGIPEVTAAGMLAMMGIFDLFGTTGSGYLSDRFDNRLLLFTYYCLRGLSLIFLPLTLIASIFGMNVKVPGEGSIHAFWVIMAVMFAVLVGVALFFRRRGWL